MKNELVSIIMPSYNTASYIQDAIKSVLTQTYPHWELLITDDASTDNSVSVIKPFTQQDPRIKLFTLTENSGSAVARNRALEEAKGRYIAFLDSDDVWLPEKLEVQLAFMQKNDYAFSYSDYSLMDATGNDLNKTIKALPSINYKQFLRNTIIGCLTVIIDKEKTGDFRVPLLRCSQDMALWLLLMRQGFTAYGLNQILAKYRLNPSSNTANKWKSAKAVWVVYRETEQLSLPVSIFNFCGYAFHAIAKRIG